ncbi:hypothetical protein EW146_g1719 [Bondarzewia mesenterica]|uniref:Uncharacterized protein n=1 Tax=Bondarzewia mesenterica TaxID=1095465 RepID=A0A4S4M2Z1_9AGAM|nr:hypothetical protein EW146_g1719 [Bondarzewia mesenterica]
MSNKDYYGGGQQQYYPPQGGPPPQGYYGGPQQPQQAYQGYGGQPGYQPQPPPQTVYVYVFALTRKAVSNPHRSSHLAEVDALRVWPVCACVAARKVRVVYPRLIFPVAYENTGCQSYVIVCSERLNGSVWSDYDLRDTMPSTHTAF